MTLMTSMTPTTQDALWLTGLTALGAALLFVHVALFIRTAKVTADHSRALRLATYLLGLLPPLTAVLGFAAGHRVLSSVWLALALAYAILRAQAP